MEFSWMKVILLGFHFPDLEPELPNGKSDFHVLSWSMVLQEVWVIVRLTYGVDKTSKKVVMGFVGA